MKGTKIIAAVIAGALTLGTITVPDIRIPQISIVADAADEIVYGDYKYTINTDSNGEYAEITRYIGSDSIVVVPSKLGGVPVKSIGVAAFGALPNDVSERGHAKECVQKVTIPEGVTTIKKWAFNQCKNLQSISLPDSLETIGLQAFWLCDSLESITIPKNASNPDGCAFWACRGLKEVVFSKGVTEISYEMFRTCTSLNSVTIPNTVTSIGNQAFGGCKKLKEINIPDSVETLGESAFSGCETLSKVKLSDNITSIQKNTFYGCTSLKEISLPYYTSTIGKDAFYNVPLEIINIGTKLKSLDNLPIHLSTLKAINVSEDNFYYSSDNGILYDKKKSSLIRFPAAINKTEYKSPDTLLNICESAFANNSSIRNVYLYEKCSSVEPTAFQNCTHLDKIYFYNKNCEIYMSKNTIYEDAVINGYKDSTAEEYANTYGRAFNTLPASTTTISTTTTTTTSTTSTTTTTATTTTTTLKIVNKGMYGDNLTWTLDNNGTLTINGIGEMADYDYQDRPWHKYAHNVKNVVIANGITNIGNNAFYDFMYLKSASIPNSVTTIGYQAFRGCWKLNSAQLPNSVKTIDDYAFYYCRELPSINIPNSVTQIGGRAFCGCETLISVSVPNSVESLGESVFSSCESLTSIILPDNLTKIDNFTFSYCSNLKEIMIPSSVTSIGIYAFQGCENLSTVIIPNSVATIDSDAFTDCKNLKKITIQNPKCQIDSYADTISNKGNNYSGIICGYENSTAQTYAKKFNRTFESLGESPITDCFKYEKRNGYIEITGIENSVISATITNTIEGLPVKSIKSTAFRGSKNLERIIIPNSVKEIGTEAFSGCTALTYVELPESITTIKQSTFYNCTKLKNITIPNSVTEIEGVAFFGCKSLETINIPSSVTKINNSTFNGCSNLSVVLPETITSVGEYAFYCKSVAFMNPKCVLPNSVYTVPGDVVIYGYKNSTAEAYAKKYNREFIVFDTSIDTPGDINCDGTVSIADLVSLQNFLLGRTKTLGNWKNADLCKDNRIDVFDMVLMRRLLIEKMN